MDGKQTLNEKPITQDNSNLDSIWDIDEPSFDEAFQIETDKGDPLAGLPTTEEKPEEAPLSENKPEAIEEDGNKVVKESEIEDDGILGSIEDESNQEKEDSLPELDLDAVGSEADKEDSQETEEKVDENEFLTFAKVLAENELLDLDEDSNIEGNVDGLVDAFGKTIKNRVKEEIDLFQKGLPLEGRELLDHLMQGGSVQNFKDAYATPDFEKVTIAGDKNVSNQKWVLAEFLRLRGDSQEEIAETIEDYEDLGKLEKQAAKAQQRLAEFSKRQKEELKLRREKEEKVKEEKRTEVLTNIQNTIDESKDIKGFPLTRKAKKDLMAYMTDNAVKVDTPNGPQYVTQFQADEMKASNNVEDFVLKAYLRMTNYDLTAVKKKSTTDFSSKLRQQLQNKKSMTGTQAKFGGNKKPAGASKTDNSNWSI
tara:strand:- start:4682 stop:5953 length:1272 start_codon:yes stop_codon:yes gene_type:complete